MRPIAVLSLLIVAVAVLVVALTRSGGSGGERSVELERGAASQAPAPAVAPSAAAPAADLLASEEIPYEAPPVPETRRQLASLPGTEADQRTSWPNELRGRVVGPKGDPIEGAKVVVGRQSVSSQIAALQSMLAPDDAPLRAKRHARTDAEGTFSVTSLQPGNDYTVVVDHDEFQRAPLSNVVLHEEGLTELEIQMRRGWVLTGYVFDEAGEPVAGAELELLPAVLGSLPTPDGKVRVSPETMTTTSAEDGYYAFHNVKEGSRTLRCSLKGYGTRMIPNLRFHGRPKDPLVEDVLLSPARSITGRVVGPDYGPIVGATVEAMYYGHGQNSRERAQTGPGGTFEIGNLVDAPYLILASAEGFTQYRQNQVEAGTSDLVIELGEQGGVHGRVVDAAGEPLSEFVCQLRKVDPKQGFYGHVLKKLSLREAEDGAFEIPAVPDGAFVVQVDAPGFASTYSETFEVTQGLITTGVLVTMSRGGTIAGFLVDKQTGAPVRGAKVTTYDNAFVENPLTDLLGAAVPRVTTARTVQTDAEGRFELSLLTPETYQIQIDHPSYTKRTYKDLRVAEGAVTTIPTVRMTVGATVSGTVLGEDGEPLAGATVELRGAGSIDLLGRVYPAVTDARGRFKIERVAGGTYTLSATSAASRMNNPFKTIIEMKNSEVRLSVVEGREYTKEVRLGG